MKLCHHILNADSSRMTSDPYYLVREWTGSESDKVEEKITHHNWKKLPNTQHQIEGKECLTIRSKITVSQNHKNPLSC